MPSKDRRLRSPTPSFEAGLGVTHAYKWSKHRVRPYFFIVKKQHLISLLGESHVEIIIPDGM